VTGRVPTWLDVRFVPGMPVQTSSTVIREALANRERREKLWSLPFAALKSIRGKNLYSATVRHLESAPRIAEPPPQ
jgi:hypothetical protein